MKLHFLASAKESQQMMSFIIEQNEHYILIDGGWVDDAPYLLQYLKDLQKKAIPHLDAIFFTHCHHDHIGAFCYLMEHHPDAFTFDQLYYNFPSVQYLAEEGKRAKAKEFYALLPKFIEKTTIMFGGDWYSVAGLDFEILSSPSFEIKENVGNNSSVAFRVHTGKSNILFLGDSGIEAGRKLVLQYGEKLKSDYCQMAHHGQHGVDEEVYQYVRPHTCLWCAPLWLWNNDAGQGFNTHEWQTVIVRGWMEKLGVKQHYVLKDGTQVIDIP